MKLEIEDVAKIKELLMAKTEIYQQIKEMQHYAENFAVGVWQEQRKIEEKYKVDFTEGKFKLDLVKNEIVEVEEKKIIT
jgi:hypothetical protein